jgi:tripartite-type tricarboxylate transporter receptor subunit TctC
MRKLLHLLLLIFSGAWQTAEAQAYPNRPVRLILPFAPGGTADIVGRPLAQKVGEILGQIIVVDNRSGAGGVVGAAFVAKSPADGYTLLLGVNGFLTVTPSLTRLPYDAINDFAPIGLVATSQFVLVLHPSVPARSVKELIALAKSKPGRLNFGSTGTGTVGHVAGELLNSMAGVNIVHVPYKGSGPMAVDLLAGQIDLGFPGVSALVPHIKAGRVRALAVTGSARSAVLPDLPTLDESGLSGYEATTFWGLLAPAKTPGDIVRKLSSALGEALKSAELKDYYVKQGNDPTASSPEVFAALIRTDTAKWARVVKSAGIKLDPM